MKKKEEKETEQLSDDCRSAQVYCNVDEIKILVKNKKKKPPRRSKN